ncbi:MAG TPA: GreA/GreB family elongation factor [Xanthobacteraceae bacterium]|nr:GreA/GreB family elongation factor [Xanthobacteraceae bacterium]
MINESLPPIHIPETDYMRLSTLAQEAADTGHPCADFLISELLRAEYLPEEEMPPDVVRLDRWVTYRVDWGQPSESRRLVSPDDHRNPAAHLSVLSPLGTALLGLRIGVRMPYGTRSGLHVATAESLDPPLGVVPLFRALRRSSSRQVGRSAPDDPNGPDFPAA